MSCLLVLSYWTFPETKKEDNVETGGGEEDGEEDMAMPFYCKERCGETLQKGERGQGARGTHAFLCISYWTSLRKIRQEAKEGGEEEGKEGKVMPFLLQGTLWGKPSRKGKGGKIQGGSCLLVLSYWTFLRIKKTRGKGKG